MPALYRETIPLIELPVRAANAYFRLFFTVEKSFYLEHFYNLGMEHSFDFLKTKI